MEFAIYIASPPAVSRSDRSTVLCLSSHLGSDLLLRNEAPEDETSSHEFKPYCHTGHVIFVMALLADGTVYQSQFE